MVFRNERFKAPQEDQADKLDLYLAKMAEVLRAKGIPVDSGLRLVMEDFVGVEGYSAEDLEKSTQYVANQMGKFHPGLTMDAIDEKEKKSNGTRFEMLKTALFVKNIGDRFIVCRSSRYDDIANKVDNVLVDSVTGEQLCIFDEVVDVTVVPGQSSSGLLQNKKTFVVGVNCKGGANVEYGLVKKGERMVPGRMVGVPVLYLAISPLVLQEGLKVFDPNTTKSAGKEANLFNYLCTTLIGEIREFLTIRDLDTKISDKLKHVNDLFELAKLA
ncbi:MAG TPA: hypothetical protein VJI73_01640 [Candidatus Paceibacterota bacterium]